MPSGGHDVLVVEREADLRHVAAVAHVHAVGGALHNALREEMDTKEKSKHSG